MDDLIMMDFEKLVNASDLIEWIMETYPDWCVGAIRSIVDHVKSMRSTQPEKRWIPVTERLPDLRDERYLVSLTWGGVGTMEYKSTGFHNYGSFSPVPIETVTAWMPLPEPYKGEQE